MKLVICPAIEAERLAKIADAAGEMTVFNAADEGAALEEMVDADAFFGKLTPPLLAAATKLRWVQCPTASLEHYLFPALVEHPCTLTNMRGLYWDVITDHVFSFILCFARNLHLYIRQQIRHEWDAVGGEANKPTFLTGPGTVTSVDRAHIHLSDCILGIVGLGSIGSEIARRGQAFGMRVLAVDLVAKEAPDGVEVWGPDHLDDLLAVSDFVVVSAPHTPDTVKMFRRAEFKKMKPSCHFINIGRGVIVDLADLVDALEAREIAGAALDVFEIEPLPAEHPLWQMENVIITPHMAAASVHVPERHLAVVLENIGRFVRNEPLKNVANKQTWF